MVRKKTCPTTNYMQTENVVSQSIRHRFLVTETKAEVVVQKMKQTGIKVRKRSVEPTITKYGLNIKLNTFRPKDLEQKIDRHYTIEWKRIVSVNSVFVEHSVREMLAEKCDKKPIF